MTEEVEPVAEIDAHNLAVITYRIVGSRDLDEAYEDDPVVHYLIDLGSLLVARTLRPTPSGRTRRARGRVEFMHTVREMQAPMLHMHLHELNVAIEHMTRQREQVMARWMQPVINLDDMDIEPRYASIFKENGMLVAKGNSYVAERKL